MATCGVKGYVLTICAAFHCVPAGTQRAVRGRLSMELRGSDFPLASVGATGLTTAMGRPTHTHTFTHSHTHTLAPIDCRFPQVYTQAHIHKHVV